MDKDAIKKKLDDALDIYQANMLSFVSTETNSDISYAIDELSRQTFYALLEFKEALDEVINAN